MTRILEHETDNERTLLFLPCTAEPAWAFERTIQLLAEKWHVFQVIYAGHEGDIPGDFSSIEATVADITAYLKKNNESSLYAAYGCSMGGACLIQLISLGSISVRHAIIDGGITPYTYPLIIRKAILLKDFLSFKLVSCSRRILEAAFPPERFTLPGHDPKREYDELQEYLRTYSNRTIRNVFWSANNYALPETPQLSGTELFYWYGEEEEKAMRKDIRFIKKYFSEIRMKCIPGMAHAELVMIHPEKFCAYAEEALIGGHADERD